MESWENKIWADKLDSLQELPVGYTPDLSSKWEIVEAGLPTGKKRRVVPLLVRWSVAAAVLLAIGFVWMNTGKGEQVGLAAIQDIISPISFRSQQAPENILLPDNKESQPLVYHSVTKTTTFPVRGDTNRGIETTVSAKKEMIAKAEMQPAFLMPDAITKQDTISIFPETVLASIAPTEKPKAVKKRIYQRDFNDGILVMDTGFSPLPRQHFSIQLNPFSKKSSDDEPPSRRLQLKQAL